jgi:hypothetical protein
MKNLQAVCLLGVAFALIGCDQTPPQAQAPPPQQKTSYQRFLPIAPPTQSMQGVPWHGFFALDTKTGSLCMTMPRVFSGSAEWVNDIPSCADILKSHPD